MCFALCQKMREYNQHVTSRHAFIFLSVGKHFFANLAEWFSSRLCDFPRLWDCSEISEEISWEYSAECSSECSYRDLMGNILKKILEKFPENPKVVEIFIPSNVMRSPKKKLKIRTRFGTYIFCVFVEIWAIHLEILWHPKVMRRRPSEYATSEVRNLSNLLLFVGRPRAQKWKNGKSVHTIRLKWLEHAVLSTVWLRND